MTFKSQFKLLADFFNREHFDYAVIGAFALFAYGYVRATQDLDVITRLDYQDKIVGHLESLGFETLNRSDGYSNHWLSVGSAKIDLVYVEGKTADAIFEAAQRKPFWEDGAFPVVSPEHLIALKLFAIKNDPDRKYKDLADIKEIFRNTPVNRRQVRDYFREYGLEEYCDEIEGK
jgi:hypothetical protein